MRDLATLDKKLLASEAELGRELWYRLKTAGYTPAKAAAIIYEYGYLDGKADSKARVNEVYRKKALADAALQAAGLPLPDYKPTAAKAPNIEQEDNNDE